MRPFTAYFYLFFPLLLLGAVNISAQTNEQKFAWVKNVDIGNKYSNIRLASTTDKDGHIYITGVTYTNVSYGANNQVLTKIGSQDAFVLKIAGDGQVVWAKQFAYASSSSQARGMSVDVDDNGNVYIAGRFKATIDFNPNPSGSAIVTSQGSNDAFLCKLDADGNFQWVKTWGRNGGAAFADHLVIDTKGDVYLTGWFNDSLNLNPGQGVQMAYATGAPNPTHPTNPVQERFLCKLDASGNYLWGTHYEEGLILNSNERNSLGLAVDTSGNAYIAGVYRNSLSFPASVTMPAIAPIGEMDMYLIKVNNSGNFVWAKGFGGPGTDIISDIKSDGKNGLYITGAFGRTADLDPNRSGKFFTSTGGSVYYDAFVLKVDTSGDFIWATNFGSSNHDNGLAVDIDSAGYVYATGSFKDSVNFVPGSSRPQDNIVSNGKDYDIFVVKLDSLGKYVWSKSMGGASSQTTAGTGPDCGDEISVDPFGNIYVTGYFRATADFNQGGTRPSVLNADDGNLFLLKYGGNCDTTYSTVEASNCGPYVFNGKTFDASGFYTEVLENQEGCDSIINLNLTIHPVPNPTITVSGFILSTVQTYATYQWMLDGAFISGATGSQYTVVQNGRYQVIVTSNDGCMDTSDVYEVTNYTGIRDRSALANSIKIYPSPSNGKVYVSGSVNLDLALFDLQGRRLADFEHPGYVDLRQAAKGVYLLRVSSKDGQLLMVERVIKQ